MSRLPRVFLGVALLGQLALLAPAWGQPFDPVSWSEVQVPNLIWLAGAILIGRVLLSLLPPGPVGRHVPGSLGETLATSLLLGLSVVHLQQAFLLPERLSRGALLGWNVAPWVVLAGVRSLMLPAAMVPGHALAHERGPAWSRWLTWLSIAAACGWSLLQGETPYWGAGLLLLDAGLRTLRRAPIERALLVAFAATVTPTLAAWFSQVQGVYLLAGLAFDLRWIRRADRRSLVLACVMCGAGSLAGWHALPILSALAVLWIGARGPQRKIALPWTLGAALLPAWSFYLSLGTNSTTDPLGPGQFLKLEVFAWERFGLLWLLLVGALLLGLPHLRTRAAPSPAPLERPDPIQRETFVALAFALSLGAGHFVSILAGVHYRGGGALTSPTALLLPAALLTVGLLIAPTETR